MNFQWIGEMLKWVGDYGLSVVLVIAFVIFAAWSLYTYGYPIIVGRLDADRKAARDAKAYEREDRLKREEREYQERIRREDREYQDKKDAETESRMERLRQQTNEQTSVIINANKQQLDQQREQLDRIVQVAGQRGDASIKALNDITDVVRNNSNVMTSMNNTLERQNQMLSQQNTILAKQNDTLEHQTMTLSTMDKALNDMRREIASDNAKILAEVSKKRNTSRASDTKKTAQIVPAPDNTQR